MEDLWDVPIPVKKMLAQAFYNVSVVLSPNKIIYYGKLFEIDYINRNFKKIFSKGYPMPEDDFVSRSTVSSHEDSCGRPYVCPWAFFRCL